MSDESRNPDEYIRELRNEAKERRLEAQRLKEQLEAVSTEVRSSKIENELIKRGVTADPNWVPVGEGQSTAEAVDAFLEKYPHLKATPGTEEEQAAPVERKTPAPLGHDSNNSSGQVNSAALKGRSVEEIRQDPKARRTLADLYKSKLYQSTPQGD